MAAGGSVGVRPAVTAADDSDRHLTTAFAAAYRGGNWLDRAGGNAKWSWWQCGAGTACVAERTNSVKKKRGVSKIQQPCIYDNSANFCTRPRRLRFNNT